jgi:hypothetical protein
MKIINVVTIISGPKDSRESSTIRIIRNNKLTYLGAQRIVSRSYPGATVERIETFIQS